MKYSRYFQLALVFAMLIVISCTKKKEDTPTPAPHTNYFTLGSTVYNEPLVSGSPTIDNKSYVVEAKDVNSPAVCIVRTAGNLPPASGIYKIVPMYSNLGDKDVILYIRDLNSNSWFANNGSMIIHFTNNKPYVSFQNVELSYNSSKQTASAKLLVP